MSVYWLNARAVDTIGWTLLHFLWEGTLLALLLYGFVAFTRNANVRHAAGVLTLVLMVSAPPLTFFALERSSEIAAASSALEQTITSLRTVAAAEAGVPSATHSAMEVNWLNCFVWVWLAGVSVFALRALGGCLLLRRVLRERQEPLASELREKCRALQQRLGIEKTVRYFQSQLIGAPAVVGWFRPVVLLPVSALTGLSTQQLEAVIVHELAHIKRFDPFINLFQITAETLLFYHPAVWWVNRLVRSERENCCDDAAVEICGDAAGYARALTSMEGWRSAPALTLAVNSGPLKKRVGRILGVESLARSVPQGGVAIVTCLCLAGALLSAATVGQLFAYPSQTKPASAQVGTPPPPAIDPASAARPTPPEAMSKLRSPDPLPPPPPELPAPPTDDADQAATAAAARGAQSSKSSYIGEMQAAGLKDLNVGNVIALKIQGVTPEFVREMRAAGFDGSAGQLIALKAQEITPDYIRQVRAKGWHNASLGQIMAMKAQGIDPVQAEEFRHQLGFSDLSLGLLVAFKVQGITPEYIRGLRSAGLKDLSPGQIMAAKVQGITPEFIQKARDQGFTSLSLHQLIALKAAGVF